MPRFLRTDSASTGRRGGEANGPRGEMALCRPSWRAAAADRMLKARQDQVAGAGIARKRRNVAENLSRLPPDRHDRAHHTRGARYGAPCRSACRFHFAPTRCKRIASRAFSRNPAQQLIEERRSAVMKGCW